MQLELMTAVPVTPVKTERLPEVKSAKTGRKGSPNRIQKRCMDCGAKHWARGYCSKCYYLHSKRGDFDKTPKAMRATGAVLARDELGRKECIDCREWLDISEYYFHEKKTNLDKLSSRCKLCIRAQKYGISGLELRAMLMRQHSRCGICKTDISELFHVDHDHDCCPGERACGKCVRGLLCFQCNSGLGLFSGDLHDAAVYLLAQTDLIGDMLKCSANRW